MEIVHREGWRTVGTSPRLLPNGGNPGERDTFHVSFDPPSEDVVGVIVNAVATIRNVEPNALDPVQWAIDPDALERLLDPDFGTESTDFKVTFVYHGLEITVSRDGDIWLEWR